MSWFAKRCQIAMALLLFFFQTSDVSARNPHRLKSLPSVDDDPNSYDIIKTGRWAAAAGTTDAIYLTDTSIIPQNFPNGGFLTVFDTQNLSAGTLSYNNQTGTVTIANPGIYRITTNLTVNAGNSASITQNGQVIYTLDTLRSTLIGADLLIQTFNVGETIRLVNFSGGAIAVQSPSYLIVEQI